jgi:hypothetical protein
MYIVEKERKGAQCTCRRMEKVPKISRQFPGAKIRARNYHPPPSNKFCVVSRSGGGVNFSSLNPKCSSVRPSEIGTDIAHVIMV